MDYQPNVMFFGILGFWNNGKVEQWAVPEYFGFGKSQARCFPLFPVVVLSYANLLLDAVLH